MVWGRVEDGPAHPSAPTRCCAYPRTAKKRVTVTARQRSSTSIHSPGRSLSAAHSLGIPAIYAEASGGGEVRSAETDAFVEGVLNVLRLLGILSEAAKPTSSRLIRDPGGDTDAGLVAPATGTWVTWCPVGSMVGEGDLLAEIYDDDGCRTAMLTAPRAGIVMMLRRHSRVTEGTSVAIVAAALQ
jgi:uncharacterized protein